MNKAHVISKCKTFLSKVKEYPRSSKVDKNTRIAFEV